MGPIVVPQVARTFGRATHARQFLAIAARSFRDVVTSWGGLALGALTAVLVVIGPTALNHLGVPLLPTTQQMTSFVGNTGEILWTIVPMLTVYYVGRAGVARARERRERDRRRRAGPGVGVRFLGTFAGLSLVLVAVQALMMVAGVLVQVLLGYHDFELALYARTFSSDCSCRTTSSSRCSPSSSTCW